MRLVFFETPLFTRLLSDYLDDEAADLSPNEKRVLKKAIQAELAVRGRK